MDNINNITEAVIAKIFPLCFVFIMALIFSLIATFAVSKIYRDKTGRKLKKEVKEFISIISLLFFLFVFIFGFIV